jgi:hypothetical protein
MRVTALTLALGALVALYMPCRAQGPATGDYLQTVALIEEPLKIPSVVPSLPLSSYLVLWSRSG